MGNVELIKAQGRLVLLCSSPDGGTRTKVFLSICPLIDACRIGLFLLRWLKETVKIDRYDRLRS